MGQRKKLRFEKVVNESYTIPQKKGGGVIKIEAWQDSSGKIVKYSIAYINHNIYQGDNGRVIGYDNAHDYHHKHYFGDISPVDDFISYEDLITRFEQDIKEYIQ
jgi:uncharacterized protein YfaT (DUF1175 family)